MNLSDFDKGRLDMIWAVAEKEGWRLADNGGSLRLGRRDVRPLFAHDEEALEFVTEKANLGSPVHKIALEYALKYPPQRLAAKVNLQVLIPVDNGLQGTAQAAVSALFTENLQYRDIILDWGYQDTGANIEIVEYDDNYEEGELID